VCSNTLHVPSIKCEEDTISSVETSRKTKIIFYENQEKIYLKTNNYGYY
jgi:hypothetical protein